MKRVMIVDDEVLVRIGIKSMTVWENYGYTIVCDASDGEEALQKIEQFHPHIVLTDLKMQGMDGFALISECGKRYPRIKFIVLSNYNDFDNVRQAMKLGAYDYVFKLTVHAEELLKIMDEASRDMELEEDAASADLGQVVYKNLDVIKNGLFKQALNKDGLFLDRVTKGFQDLTLKIDWNSPYCLLSIQIDSLDIVKKRGDFLETDLLLFSMGNIIGELMERGFRAEVFQYQDYDFAVAVNRESSQSRSEFGEMLSLKFQTLVKYISQYYGFGISGALSRECRGVGQIRQAAEENRMRLDGRFFQETGILLIADGGTAMRMAKEPPKPMELSENLQLPVLDGILGRGDFYGVNQYLEQLLEVCGNERQWNPQEVRAYLTKVCRRLSVGLSGHGIETEKVKDRNGASMVEAVGGYTFYEEIRTSLEELLAKILELYKKEVGRPCRREISDVMRYVGEHLEEELTVAKVAELAGMSESRFAHVFKEETGVSFMEYVSGRKMEKARELLQNTDLRVNEIAERIGIFNPNYFSAQYKKKTGQSPNEFRKSLLQQGKKES